MQRTKSEFSTTRPAEGTPPVPPVPPAVDVQYQGDGDDPDRNRFRELCRCLANGFYHEVYVYAPDRLDRGHSD